MSKIDQEFQSLCKKILNEGVEYENKNRGVKRLQIPSYTLRHSFKDGFPAITNKKLYWKGIVAELIWFLRGDSNVVFLNQNGIKIWNKDAYNWYVKHASKNTPAEANCIYRENIDESYSMFTFEEFVTLIEVVPDLQHLKDNYSYNGYTIGDVGQNYSVQWRNFNAKTDQIKELIDMMKKDIMSSRLKVNAWNPSELNETALPPCHSEFQIIGVPLSDGNFGFELHWNQRSVDTFLGLPFNIASYGLLAKILEQITGYKALAIEGTLKCVHFYDNQYEAANELLQRDPDTHTNCNVDIHFPAFDYLNDIDDLFNWYKISNFKLVGYSSDEEIKVAMLAPKN